MYTMTRTEGATLLGVSTRTVDRYIRSDRIRTKKIGKQIYLNNEDIDVLRDEDHSTIAALDTDDGETSEATHDSVSYETLYHETAKSLEEKEAFVGELTRRISTLEAELKTCITIAEHKRITFPLESAKARSDDEKRAMKTRLEGIEKASKAVRRTNALLMIMFVIMLLTLAGVWLIKV